ncbi:flagellar basal body-associated FliL family protein [Frigidibacter sp. MR17.24]|uniref:flagellar basal body-associated FliL family protein n=1 Tax=Frigidibacter sp. MR17.24 TaxID=3127345 RepID=UPI003012E3A7
MSKAPASARKGADAAPAAAGAAPAGTGRRKLILIAVIAVSLLAGGGGLYFALFMRDGDTTETAAEDGHGEAPAEGGEEHAAEGHGAAEPAEPGAEALYELQDMTLNIRGFTPTGAPVDRLIRISMTLSYDADALERHAGEAPEAAGGGHGGGEAAPSGIDASIPHLRDVFLDYLRQITTRDLDGSLGFATVKAELLKRAKAVMGADVPREVLIRDLVVQ